MRFTPLVGEKAWFGPRRHGWPPGWEPVSWEGWVATLGWVVVMLGGVPYDGPARVAVAVVGALGLLATCVLKGTSPGGPEAGDRFAEIRRYAKRTPEQTEADRVRRRLTADEPSVSDAAVRLRRVRPRRQDDD
jgi:hypothetical protein